MKKLFLAVFTTFFFAHVGLSNAVISDQSGNPIVLQIGQDYKWNDTLDGVMLWGVWQDDDTNDWVIATVNYIGGRQKGAKGSYSALPAELDVDHPYTINGDTIDVTEDNGHQYYQVTSVEGDIIFAVDGDDFPLTDSSWWFAEKSSAELFYNTKLGNAPSALTGLRVSIDDEQNDPSFVDFPAVEKYFTDQYIYGNDDLGAWSRFPYTYVKTSSDQGELTIQLSEEYQKSYSLSFSSTTEASGNWDKSEDNSSGITSITINTDLNRVSSLSGKYYQSSYPNPNYPNDRTMDYEDRFIFFNDGEIATIHFPYHPDANGSLTESITYNYEIFGGSVAKLSPSIGDDTWMFFINDTEGKFDLEGDDLSGSFSLNAAADEYPSGYAKDEISGDVISIGTTQYLFQPDRTVFVYYEDGSTSTSTYTFFRTDDNNAILKINGESLEMNLKFLDLDYGRITDGGSGYFLHSENYATKGWVWYDDLPWIYSNNQAAWMYQYLSVNGTSGDSELHYHEPWSGAWKLSNDLNYTDQRVFTRDGFEPYDDFSGDELNTSKWDVAWWEGGTSPLIDQDSGQIIFSRGSDVGARLSSKMKASNGGAEAKYDRDLSGENGFAPDSIVGLKILIHDIQDFPEVSPEEADYGEEAHEFSDDLLTRYDWDDQKDVQETYTYQKTGPSEAQLRVESPGQVYIAELSFSSPTDASGTWTENEEGQVYSGTTTHKVIYQPHSLLEFSESDQINGIEFELMIPADAPNETCIGLYAIDYEKMFNATSEEEEMQAIKFDLDLCYFGNLMMEYYYYDPVTFEEQKNERQVTFGQYNKAAFMYEGDNIVFYFNDEIIAEYPLTKGNEMYVFRAMNEQNSDFSAYLRNVRVFRKKSYPKGWMWTDYYPWAYSHETGNWIYFELAKDSAGDPVMNYWDSETEQWDIYEPAMTPFTER